MLPASLEELDLGIKFNQSIDHVVCDHPTCRCWPKGGALANELTTWRGRPAKRNTYSLVAISTNLYRRRGLASISGNADVFQAVLHQPAHPQSAWRGALLSDIFVFSGFGPQASSFDQPITDTEWPAYLSIFNTTGRRQY